MGELLLGVRCSTDDGVAARLRSVLADRYRPGVDAPPNLGVVLGGTVDGITTKHTLYSANRRVFRSVSDERVLRALVRRLGEHAMVPPESDDVVDVAGVVLVAGGQDDGEVTLVDARLAWALDDMTPRLAAAGVGIVDTGVVHVDLSDRSVDLTLPGGFDDAWRRADVAGSRPDRVALDDVAPRYRLARLVTARGPGAAGAVPAVVAAMGMLARPGSRNGVIPDGTVDRWLAAMDRDLVHVASTVGELEGLLVG